jgi:hypothetical protein
MLTWLVVPNLCGRYFFRFGDSQITSRRRRRLSRVYQFIMVCGPSSGEIFHQNKKKEVP